MREIQYPAVSPAAAASWVVHNFGLKRGTLLVMPAQGRYLRLGQGSIPGGLFRVEDCRPADHPSQPDLITEVCTLD